MMADIQQQLDQVNAWVTEIATLARALLDEKNNTLSDMQKGCLETVLENTEYLLKLSPTLPDSIAELGVGVDDLLGFAQHEYRWPSTSIRGHTGLILSDSISYIIGTLDTKQKECVNRIYELAGELHEWAKLKKDRKADDPDSSA